MSSHQLGHPKAHARIAEPQTAAAKPNSREQMTADYLDYLADVVLELKEMAARANADTLAALLDVAHREAKLQLQRNK